MAYKNWKDAVVEISETINTGVDLGQQDYKYVGLPVLFKKNATEIKDNWVFVGSLNAAKDYIDIDENKHVNGFFEQTLDNGPIGCYLIKCEDKRALSEFELKATTTAISYRVAFSSDGTASYNETNTDTAKNINLTGVWKQNFFGNVIYFVNSTSLEDSTATTYKFVQNGDGYVYNGIAFELSNVHNGENKSGKKTLSEDSGISLTFELPDMSNAPFETLIYHDNNGYRSKLLVESKKWTRILWCGIHTLTDSDLYLFFKNTSIVSDLYLFYDPQGGYLPAKAGGMFFTSSTGIFGRPIFGKIIDYDDCEEKNTDNSAILLDKKLNFGALLDDVVLFRLNSLKDGRQALQVYNEMYLKNDLQSTCVDWITTHRPLYNDDSFGLIKAVISSWGASMTTQNIIQDFTITNFPSYSEISDENKSKKILSPINISYTVNGQLVQITLDLEVS